MNIPVRSWNAPVTSFLLGKYLEGGLLSGTFTDSKVRAQRLSVIRAEYTVSLHLCFNKLPGMAGCFCARRSGLWDPSALTGCFPSAFRPWSLTFYIQTSAPAQTQDWDSDRLFPPQRNSGLARNVQPTVSFISLALWELIIIMVNTLLQPCHRASCIFWLFMSLRSSSCPSGAQARWRAHLFIYSFIHV